MRLDKMTKERILTALAAQDEKVREEMASRLRQVMAMILASDATRPIYWKVPNTAANRLVIEEANKAFPHVTVRIRNPPSNR